LIRGAGLSRVENTLHNGLKAIDMPEEGYENRGLSTIRHDNVSTFLE
jgi:hypothetical protein